MEDFLLKVGIDGSGVKNPLNEMIDTMQKVEDSAKDAGKVMQDSFNQSSNVIDKIEQKLKPVTKNLDALKAAGRAAGKELADAFKSGDTAKLEKQVQSFAEKLNSINGKVDIEIDDAALAKFEQQLQNTDNAVQQLAAGVEFAKSVLSQLDPNSEEFQTLSANIEVADAAITEFGDQMQATAGKQKTLKSELKELKQELAAMELRGEAGSQKFKEMSARAGELTDQIGDTNAQIKALASDTKGFDALISGAQGLVGGFTAAQGAIGLFAGENEDLEKVLLKVNSAMAVLQGLQAVANTLNKDSAFSVILLRNARAADQVATEGQTAATIAQTIAMNGATLATKLLRIGLASIGIGLIISLIAYLVANWEKLKKSMDDILPTGAKVGNIFNDLKVIASGVGAVIVNGIVKPIEILIDLTRGDLKSAIDDVKDYVNILGAYEKGAADMTKKIAKDAALEAKKARLDDWDAKLKIEEAGGKNTFESRKKWYQNTIAYEKKMGNDTREKVQELAEFQARHDAEQRRAAADRAKKAADEAQKRREEAQRRAEEAARAAAEAAKKQNDLLAKYTEELAKMKVDKMQEGFEKEKKSIEVDAQTKIDQLKKDGATRADVLAKQKELEQAITDAKNAKIAELEKKHNEEIAAVKMEGARMILDFQKDSTQKSLDIAELDHQQRIKDIEKRFKDETELQASLLEAEAKYFETVKQNINREANQKSLNEREQAEISGLEIMYNYGNKSIEAEEQKQIGILEIKKKYATEQLNNLLLNGGSDVEINNAILAVQEVEKALDDYSKKGKKFDMFKFLGLGDKFTGEQKQQIIDGAQQIAENLGQMADFIVDQYQRQIDKKQEVIDQMNSEIDTLEGNLEKEKQLRDEGLANNYDALAKELEDKKAARDEELRQQQELQEKKARMQKLQMAADTAVQLVNMITASTNIFESFSKIPFVGVPLAIAMIATMFGAFAAAKIKAFQSIKDGQKFRHGGEIGFGGSHEDGGSKFYSADGSGFEAEKGEFITKKDSYRKYKKFVKAFNDDDFSGLTWNDFEAVGLFEKLGISLQNDEVDNAVKYANDNKTVLHEFSFAGGNNEHFGKMNENLQYLADSERGKSEYYEDEKFYYEKKGTRITKRPKK